MYHHGFAMLALGRGLRRRRRPPGLAGGKEAQVDRGGVELAVRAAVTSQKKNSMGGWRYSPDSSDADTSVSGAVLVGLLAARNAGIEVPDESIDKAISFYTKMTSSSGQVAYAGGMGGFNESLARHLDRHARLFPRAPQGFARIQSHHRLSRQQAGGHRPVGLHGISALLPGAGAVPGRCRGVEKMEQGPRAATQGNPASRWQHPGQFGGAVGTSLSILALALNFRFLPIYER